MCSEITGVQKEIDTLSSMVKDIAAYEKRPARDRDSHVLKAKKIDKMIVDGEKVFQEAGSSVKQEAMYWYLWGTMYNCSPKYVQEGIEVLKRAVVIDPDLIDAWNELGECYWGIMEVDLARYCFERALNKSVNKVSLRNLSAIRRSLCFDMAPKDKINHLNDALLQAKAALNLDLTDGQSWSTLGNSYLAVFFSSPLQQQHILQAIACYTQAERNLGSADKTEVFFNKAVAYKHLENYSSALEYLSKCLKSDPAWDLPVAIYGSLIQYLEKIRNIIGCKGKLQSKRYKAMLKDLESQIRRIASSRYVVCNIRDLKAGENKGSVVYGKVLWTINEDTFPVTFGLVGAKGNEIVVTVFNSNPCLNFFKIGDNVAIFDPHYDVVEFTQKEEYKFKKVRINNPATLLINNKPLPQRFYADYSFETSPN